MTLNFISLGLFDKEDLSIKAIHAITKCDSIYIEKYTNYLDTSIKELGKFLGKSITELKRHDLEDNSSKILEEAKGREVALLVPGHVFAATTHLALLLEAKRLKIKTRVIHSSSIFTAISETGLSLYRFGQVTSVPFHNKGISSPYTVIKKNLKQNLHTLLLLDIKDDAYMTGQEAIKFLLYNKASNNVFKKDSLCIVCAALGSERPDIIAGKAREVVKKKIAKFPQCLIVPARLSFVEEEAIKFYKIGD